MRPILLVALLAAGIGIGTRTFSGGNEKKADVPTHLLIALDLSSPDERTYAKALLDQVSRRIRHYQRLSLDVLDGGNVQVVYSNVSKRTAIEEFIEHEVVERPASDLAIAESLQRIRQYGHDLRPGERLVAIIVTSGTSNSVAIKQLKSICGQIPRSGAVTVYVAGLAPANRQVLAPVFYPIRANAQVLGRSESELSALMKKL